MERTTQLAEVQSLKSKIQSPESGPPEGGTPNPEPADSELMEETEVRNIEVWAQIKGSSKYYHQGLVDPTNSKSQARFFKLSHFTPLPELGTRLCRDAYVLHFNSNTYRIEDCMLFLVSAETARKHLNGLLEPVHYVRIL